MTITATPSSSAKRQQPLLALPLARVQRHLDRLEAPRPQGDLQLVEGGRVVVRHADPADRGPPPARARAREGAHATRRGCAPARRRCDSNHSSCCRKCRSPSSRSGDQIFVATTASSRLSSRAAESERSASPYIGDESTSRVPALERGRRRPRARAPRRRRTCSRCRGRRRARACAPPSAPPGSAPAGRPRTRRRRTRALPSGRVPCGRAAGRHRPPPSLRRRPPVAARPRPAPRARPARRR